jgi:hypothetical protein
LRCLGVRRGDVAAALCVAHQHPEVAQEPVAGLRAVLQIEAVTDRVVADDAHDVHASGAVDGDEPVVRVVHRRVAYVGAGVGTRDEVEVDRIPSESPELAHAPKLGSFDAHPAAGQRYQVAADARRLRRTVALHDDVVRQ